MLIAGDSGGMCLHGGTAGRWIHVPELHGVLSLSSFGIQDARSSNGGYIRI